MEFISKNISSCGSCPIRYRSVCSLCDDSELSQLDAIKYYRTFEAGVPILWREDKMDFVASVVTGVATLTQTMEDGRTQMLGLLLPSDFIGRPERNFAPYDITAVTAVTLCCFPRQSFQKIMLETPHVGHRLLEMALDELDAARDWMMLLGRKTAREKIASLLVLVARRTESLKLAPAGTIPTIQLPLTREAMANFLGLTLETVSRQFSKLNSEGIIALEGRRRVKIPNFPKLLAETGDDSDERVMA